MSYVKVTKEYIQFKDNSKMSGIFPPIGMVILWPGDTNYIPDGYLRCNGDILDKEETINVNSNEKKYESLFEKIGYNYGSVNGDSNKFKIPDMREKFPLGINQSGLSNMNSGDITGGVKQLENSHFKHTHTLDASSWTVSLGSTAAENPGNRSSHLMRHGVQTNTSASLTTESGNNEDYLSKFTVILFLIRYKNF